MIILYIHIFKFSRNFIKELCKFERQVANKDKCGGHDGHSIWFTTNSSLATNFTFKCVLVIIHPSAWVVCPLAAHGTLNPTFQWLGIKISTVETLIRTAFVHLWISFRLVHIPDFCFPLHTNNWFVNFRLLLGEWYFSFSRLRLLELLRWFVLVRTPR